MAVETDDSEDASNGMVIRLLPLPTGRRERETEVLCKGSLTAAMIVWLARKRYFVTKPLPIPFSREALLGLILI